MKKGLVAGVLVLCLFSCDEHTAENRVDTSVERQSEVEQPSDEVEMEASSTLVGNDRQSARAWLIQAIEGLFSEELSNFETITTKEFYEYKMDAMNVDFDHGLSVEDFQKKWKGKYDVSSNALDKGFLIDAQDNGKIKVKKCQFLRHEKKEALVFQVVLYDELFKSTYMNDVTVIPENGAWIIANVKDHFIR